MRRLMRHDVPHLTHMPCLRRSPHRTATSVRFHTGEPCTHGREEVRSAIRPAKYRSRSTICRPTQIFDPCGGQSITQQRWQAVCSLIGSIATLDLNVSPESARDREICVRPRRALSPKNTVTTCSAAPTRCCRTTFLPTSIGARSSWS